jgi:DNA-binding protein HU-beta
MNYIDFIDDVATRSKRRKGDAKLYVDTVIEALGDALVRGDEVRLLGIGTLTVLAKPARTGAHPQTREPIDIAAKRVPKLRPGRALMLRLNPPEAAVAEKKSARKRA